MRWDSAPSRETREGVAPPPAGGVASSGRVSYAPPVSGTLDRGTPARSGGQAGYFDQMVPETVGALTNGAHSGGGGLMDKMHSPDAYLPHLANPLTARMHKGANTNCDEGQTLIPCTK